MVTMCERFNLLIFIAVILHVGLILTSKHEMLKSAIQSSQFKRDVKFDKNSVTCLKCKVLISTESSNHFSNVLRHFNSESHKFKTQWCVKDDSVKNILSVVSLKQKSTLLTFFGGKMKDKKTQSQVPNAPIPVSNTKLQCEIYRESEITIKELQLKEKLLQQNTEMNKCKANELCYVFQKDYQENKKDEGNDMQNMRFYMETLASNIEKHITCKEDLMLNEIETKKTILLQIEKFKYQQISYTVNAIELSDDMKNINLKFLQDFIGDKLAIFSSILDKKRFFQERFTTTELIKSLEEKGPDPNSPDTDVYIKFSVLLQKENCLSDFLGDILQNMNKRRPIWSESTVNLYSLLLNYGGPVAVDLMRRNLGGPSLSRVYLQARQTIPIETSLTETSFRNAAEFYKKVCKDVDIKSIIFTIAVDATPVLPLIRAKGNKLLGFATNKDIIVQSAEDVIQVFKDDSLLRAQQTYVFALVPLRSDIPYCILAAPPVVKGENQGTALNWLIKSKEWGQQYNLNIYGLGADGDSKIRSFYVHRYLKNHGCNDFTIDRQDFTFSLPQNQFDSIDCPFPDPRHLLKKWRNQLLNIRRLLIMGDHLVQLEHLMELADIEEIKHTLGLWKTDIRVNDKQNVNAAIRLFNPNVQSHLKEYGGDKYAGTIVYLHLGQILNEIYFNKELSIRKRIKFSWTLVQFCRLWKTCIVLSKYKTDKTFISDQTYNDVIIAGHSIILMTKLHFLHHKNQPFEPWTWGSNSCEDIFSKSRCFIRTKNNFCYAEFLDICRRIQKVTETESDFNKPSKKQVFLGINLTTDINILIEEEMRHGDIYAKELLEKTEMHTLLQKAGIIDENNKIDISTWSNKQQIYHSDIDELEDLSQDELLSLNDEEILFTVVANDVELLHSADLLDMACDDIVDHAKDEELNLNGSEQSSNSEMHAPLPDGPVALSTSLTETHQTTGQNEQVIQEKETRKNTHIFYKGNWYHISQFVSWEQGKFYMPKQSRLNRFYSNYAIFDKFLPPESLLNQDKHLTRGDFIATWNNGIFCFGKLMRIVKPSVKGKCAHPQFIWKKSNEGAATTDFAIQILRSTNKQQETVPGSLIITKTFKWVSSAEFVLKLILQPKDGYFIMDSSCRQQLIDAITYLQENDKKEEKRQREDKKRKFDEKKSGPPEKMTVQILKSLLKENGVRFTSKDKKADLVKLVKEKISSSNPSRVAKRMDGFELYVTNTSTIPPHGYLCYADPNPTRFPIFPNITQTISCNQLGKYVVYYDGKASDEGNRIPGPIVELCYVAIKGCAMSYWGINCDKYCPENCLGQHCFIGTGYCVWGCNAENCFGNNCNRDTSICTEGCIKNRTGLYCNKYNMATESLVSQYPNGSEPSNKANDGYMISCSKTQGHNVKFQVDLKKESIVTGIDITLGELTTKNGMHSVYGSNTSTWTNGVVLYNGNVLPKEIHFNEVFRYLTYLPKIQGSLFDLEICEIGIIGCPPTHYGPVCDQRCPENCHGPCDLETGLCIFGCPNGWNGDECKQACSGDTYGKDCLQACSTNCLNPTCNRINGECIGECNYGWKGLDCTIKCRNGSFGRNCEGFCEGCISTMCDNSNGLCENTTSCKPGYAIGEYCNTICDDWYFGNNCTKQCHCLEKSCNNDDGICSPEGCKEGWHGKSCDQACDDWYFGNNCAWKCYCMTGPCNQFTGKCPPGGCQKGWHGVACEVYTVTTENKPLMSTYLGLFIGGFLVGILMATTSCFLARKRRKLRKKQGNETVTEKKQSHEQQHYDDVRMENISTYQDLMTRQTTHDYEHIKTAFVRQ